MPSNDSMEAVYDFIVIGAGASGCVVASRLADAASKPSVLLFEAGGSNDSISDLSASERFNVAFSPNSPLNWNYKTTPQNQLCGQQIDYSRGKGLGGSTAINFCGWIVGSRDDYDEWARLVDDDSFSWNNARRCLDKVETLHPKIPNPKLQKYVNPTLKGTTQGGPLHLTYGEAWDPNLESIFVAAEQAGLGTNADVNSGDPLGMGMGTVCIYNGKRLTSSIAYLSSPPSNITILPDSAITKIIFNRKRAVAVLTLDNRIFSATKEIIVCGGAINTPQILMLSGVGPKGALEKHRIPVMHELPHLGKNLQDHCFSSVGIVSKKDPADTEFQQSPSPMGWFKTPSIQSSPEFGELPQETKEFFQRQFVPSIEIATHTPPGLTSYTPNRDEAFLGAMCLVMNPQSRGTVTLQSSSPSRAPRIDPNFLSHPYDRRVLIDGLRQTMKLLSTPIYAKTTIELIGPKDESDAEIWEYIKCNTHSSWHMSCTARMGKDVSSACVDSDFRVFGLEALRIVDLSVCPFVPNNHTQSTAYIIGEIAAEKLIEEYGLEASRPEQVVARL